MEVGPTIGPSGPNETWVEGDLAPVNAFQAVKISAEQADSMNKQAQEGKAKAAAAELTRQDFMLLRPCPKCRFEPDTLNESATVHFQEESSHCTMLHGRSEHIDRRCQICHYEWAENLPTENWKDTFASVHFHFLNNH